MNSAAAKLLVVPALAIILIAVALLPADEPLAAVKPRLLIAFCSHRDRPAFVNIYFYEHDGIGQGRIIGSIPTTEETADYHPSLTPRGLVCAHASKRVGGHAGQINLWDVKAKKALARPAFNEGFGARVEPAISGTDLLAYSAWERSGGAGGWDIVVYDTKSEKQIDLPGLNGQFDEREASLSKDGRYLAFVSNRPGGKGSSDIYLYDRKAAALVPLPGLNSPQRELNPSLSADGRFLAFVSDRPGGAGGKDVYLYDRTKEQLLPLPGLNSASHEQTPALSPDGRYLVFVSERISGAGERDIYLYDRERQKLLPTPGLNSKQEDFDPSIADWSGQ